MKRIKSLLAIFLIGTALVGCTNSKLSEDFNEEELKSDSAEVIQMLCDEEYDKLENKMSDRMKEVLAAVQIKEAWEPLEAKLGKYDSVIKEAVVGNEVEGEELATVVKVVKFENGKIQFNITYDKNIKLDGLYMK